jgi:predicted ATPase
LGTRIAAEALESFPDGVFMVDLARLTDPDLVPSATATALGLREQPGQSLAQTLADYLHERKILLLFDNFEHVLPAATLVPDLLASAPGLKVLATSRARLGLLAEREYRVEPMPIPDQESLPPLAELSSFDAIELFTSRAQALRPDFSLTKENAPTVAEIVCRLDGLPLSIELAAARVKILSPEALLDRLDRRLSTLTGGARDLPARQRTLRDTIAWSHDLLPPPEKTLFRRLSVFVGGWTLEASEAMATVDGGEAVDAFQALATLVDQSLVDEWPTPDALASEPRYGMLESIREFASEQLAASGEMIQAERSFEAFFIGRAKTAATGLSGPDQPKWLERLEADHDNLRAALGRALERSEAEVALQLAPRLWQFWRLRGYLGEGRSWLERALAAAPRADAALRALAELGLGELCIDLGDYPAADKHFRTCVALRRELGDMVGVAEGLTSLAVVALNLRDYREAQSLGEEALRISREHGDVRVTGRTLHDLGLIAREQGDYERARQLFQESLTGWRKLNDLFWIASVALGLGITHVLNGNSEEAQAPLQEARTLYERLGDRFGVAVAATEMGHLARTRGDSKQAIALFGEALRFFAAIGASEAVVYCIEWIGAAAAEQNDASLALRLFGAAEAARITLHLPPAGERDARLVNAGVDSAVRAAGDNAESLLAAGRRLSLDQARNEALRFVDQLTAGASASHAAGRAAD